MILSENQEKALEQISEIARANFDEYLIHLRKVDENLDEGVVSRWFGHNSTIVGISEIGHSRVRRLVEEGSGESWDVE
jgi:hypothetical protein